MKHIEVVAAIIHDDEGRIFATQRGYGDYKDGWEFPGGKIECGETPEQALARECWEELRLDIEHPTVLRSVVHSYPEKTIRLILVECRIRPGSSPDPQEGQAVAWFHPSELDTLPVCPADRELFPFVFGERSR